MMAVTVTALPLSSRTSTGASARGSVRASAVPAMGKL